ncbi:unnamed protein product [Prorocentrum cordatum]|uniref:Uncharacterized protein n=1 Tax=Prorocentrum cordatum TaxID=2364126 RepID=A0ABN9WQ38_9DINO|nr:unnamed protein product [Polarella glacialis]
MITYVGVKLAVLEVWFRVLNDMGEERSEDRVANRGRSPHPVPPVRGEVFAALASPARPPPSGLIRRYGRRRHRAVRVFVHPDGRLIDDSRIGTPRQEAYRILGIRNGPGRRQGAPVKRASAVPATGTSLSLSRSDSPQKIASQGKPIDCGKFEDIAAATDVDDMFSFVFNIFGAGPNGGEELPEVRSSVVPQLLRDWLPTGKAPEPDVD